MPCKNPFSSKYIYIKFIYIYRERDLCHVHPFCMDELKTNRGSIETPKINYLSKAGDAFSWANPPRKLQPNSGKRSSATLKL